MKQLIDTRFGGIEYDDTAIVSFAHGIPAFEEEKSFIVFPLVESGPYQVLQSLQTPELAFIIVNPFLFFPDYEFSLTDDVVEALAVKSPDDIDVYSIVTIPKGDVTKLTANLLAPVVINRANLRARQVVLDNTSYTTKQPLFAQAKGE